MSAGRREPFKVPAAVVIAVMAPFALSALWVGGMLMVRAYSGPFGGVLEDGWWRIPAILSAPGAVMGLAILRGRLKPVEVLPDPTHRDAPPPSVLALPGGGAGGSLRPVEKAPRTAVGRRAADGVLFVSGLAVLAAAFGMGLVQQESFDSVLGIKLGGIWFRGTYWNRWWFVFYATSGVGVALLTSSLALFIRRLNRREA